MYKAGGLQGNKFKFIDDIPGEPLAYVEHISQVNRGGREEPYAKSSL